MSLDQSGQWSSVAEVFLKAVGHPLRPVEDDLRAFELLCQPIFQNQVSSKALILGVTPELHELLQPNAITFAMDRTQDMIEHVWPGRHENVIQKDWLELGQLEESFDLILLDGGLHLVSYPKEQIEFLSAISQKLKPGGRFIIRLFTPPEKGELVDEVIHDFETGNMKSVNHFKVRLGNALQSTPSKGVVLDEIYRTVVDKIPDFESKARSLGWSEMESKAIQFYGGKHAVYSFVTLAEVMEMLAQLNHNLELLGTLTPTYHMGDQFPVLGFTRT